MLQILVAISQGQPFVNIHPEVSIKADTLTWEDLWLLNSLDSTGVLQFALVITAHADL